MSSYGFSSDASDQSLISKINPNEQVCSASTPKECCWDARLEETVVMPGLLLGIRIVGNEMGDIDIHSESEHRVKRSLRRSTNLENSRRSAIPCHLGCFGSGLSSNTITNTHSFSFFGT